MSRGGTAKLTIQLVDAVSGPAKAASAALKSIGHQMDALRGIAVAPGRELGRQAAQIRAATANLAPVGAALSVGFGKMAKDVYNLEKQLNISQAAGGLDYAHRNSLMTEAVKLNEKYAATSSEIVAGANELLRSGLNYDQTIGSLNGVLDASQAFDVSISESSAGIVTTLTQMRLGMRTTDEAMKNSTRVADLYAVAMNETAGITFDDFRTSGKYFNPVATAVGMSPEEAFALQSTLGKAGIYGSSAGTGLRSAPTSIVAPSKGGRAAFGRLGLDPSDFVGKRTGAASGGMVSGALEAMGLSAEGLDEGMQRIIDDPRLKRSPAKIANAILDRFGEELGVATGEDRMAAAEAIQNSLAAGAKKVDLVGVLRSMRDRGAGLADYVGVFGKNHASKLMAIDVDEYQRQLDKMNKADGTAARQREQMMAGIVGDVNALGAAWEAMAVAIGKAGLLADAAKAISKMSVALNDLAKSNPELLRLGSYAALSLAALAPLGFALSGTAAALALMVNPLALVVGSLGVLAALNFRPIADSIAVFSKSLVHALDPSIVGGMKSMADAFGSLFSLRLGGKDGDGLGQAARNLGLGAAAMANSIGGALPNLDAFAKRMTVFASGAIATGLPIVSDGLRQIGQALAVFASDKLSIITTMGGALSDFAQKAGPFFSPAIASGATLIGQSFQTLSAGFQAVYRVADGVTKGMVAFASAFLGGIDGAAVSSLANVLSGAFNGLAIGLGWLKQGFDAIDLSFLTELGAIAGSGTGAVIGEAIKGVAAGVRTGAEALLAAAELLMTAVARHKEAMNNLGSVGMWDVGPSFGGKPLWGGGSAAAAGGAAPAAPAASPGVDGHRAAGGPLRRGMSYRVGERGPEVITPSTNGYVTPNHRLGGGGDVIVNIGTINAPGAGPNVATDIAKALKERLGRSRQLSMTGRPVS